MITLENYEEYMMMAADGELQPHEEAALNAFLEEHPELQHEMAAYNNAILTPDMTQVYAQKETLLKPVPAGRKIAFAPGWRSLAAAAGIAAILVTIFFAMQDRSTSIQVVASAHHSATVTPGTASATNKAVAPTGTIEEHADSNPATPDNDITSHERQTPANTNSGVAVKVPHTQNGRNQRATPQTIKTVQPERVTEQLVAMNTADIKKVPVQQNQFKMAVAIAEPEYKVAMEPVKTSWIDKLPIDEDKKEKLGSMANAVASGVNKAGSLKESLNEKSLSIRVEKKKLILSF